MKFDNVRIFAIAVVVELGRQLKLDSPGALPGQTKCGGQHGWGVVRGVPSQVGVGSGIQSEAYQYAPQRINPRNTLGKKWGGHDHPSPSRGNAPGLPI